MHKITSKPRHLLKANIPQSTSYDLQEKDNINKSVNLKRFSWTS